MRKGHFQFKTAGLLVIMVCAFAITVGAVATRGPLDGVQEQRADLIIIDGLKSMGDLERPPVPFFHSRHTEALAKINRDCASCHQADKGNLSPKFMRLVDKDRKTVMDTYHEGCISCHKETRSTKIKSGPVTCGECHVETLPAGTSWKEIRLDKTLHYKHVRENENKCERCHHEYNKDEKKLVYAKGKEGSCTYCHGDVKVDNRIPEKEAAHQSCIGCHREREAKNKAAGPVSCVGCHDPESQKTFEVIKDIPRMKRNQPDTVFVSKGESTLAGQGNKGQMALVPFDHKAHEKSNNSCRVCHHKSLDTCAKCHDNTGKDEGQQVKLAQAMHKAGSDQSCIGCHQSQQAKPECAGCHAVMATTKKPQDESCSACHMTPPGTDGLPVDKNQQMQMAQYQLDTRTIAGASLMMKDVPEKVIINKLENQYYGVEFPHRKVVSRLQKDIEDNKLAGFFHQKKETLCQGCHHNTPAAEKPPACGSCHGQPFEADNLSRPGLAGAYHQQCIQCHDTMGIKKPDSRDCSSCHAEKNKGQLS